ncbi:MAG: SurA N-terminal domain-containing protein, partial [Gammaproteobacteria bacterium]|nr:SurA N-terminal domain-containing protein [Gammaproteobacteria bacterium]
MTQNRPQRTFRTAALLTLAAGLLVPAAAPAQLSPNAEPIDSIVALVDEDVILRSELDLAVAGIVERVRASGDAMPPMNLIESQVLERLIIRELQIQRALITGIRISDADIDEALVLLAQQNGLTIQQMRQLIEADGEDFSEFRRNIGEELMTERLRQRIVNSMDPVTETEIDILLASEELGGGEYNVSH